MSSSDPVVAVVEKMAGENMRELHELQRALNAFMHARGYAPHKTCINCAHWKQLPQTPLGGTCGLYNAPPPAVVIANACPAWEDEIPF